MRMFVREVSVNLKELIDPIDLPTNSSFTIGNMRANTLKMIYCIFLLLGKGRDDNQKYMRFHLLYRCIGEHYRKSSVYESMRRKKVEALLALGGSLQRWLIGKKQCEIRVSEASRLQYNVAECEDACAWYDQFTNHLDYLPTGSQVRLRFIGGLLAGQGNCDYLTLLLIEKMHSSNINFTALASATDVAFIVALEKYGYPTDNRFWMRECGDAGLADVLTGSCSSLSNLSRFLDSLNSSPNVFAEMSGKIKNIYKNCYLQHLKLIDYELEGDKLIIFSYGPVSFKVIADIAEYFELSGDCNSVEATSALLDEINKAFLRLASEDGLYHILSAAGAHAVRQCLSGKVLTAADIASNQEKSFHYHFVHAGADTDAWPQDLKYYDNLNAEPEKLRVFLPDEEIEDAPNSQPPELLSIQGEIQPIIEKMDERLEAILANLESCPSKHKMARSHVDNYKDLMKKVFFGYFNSDRGLEAKNFLHQTVRCLEKSYCRAVLGLDRSELTKAGRYFKMALANLSCLLLVPILGLGFYLFKQNQRKTGSPWFFKYTASKQALKELNHDLSIRVAGPEVSMQAG